jgi:hypothetical protein
MSAYKPVYSIEFESDIDSFEFDKNAADGLEKAIPIILERPYYKAIKIKGGNGLLRKHVCANRFRIFMMLMRGEKKYILLHSGQKTKTLIKIYSR